MKAKDIRDLASKDLNTKVVELKKELYHLRFQHAVGQLENTAQLRSIRKNIARIKTVLTERGE